MSSITNMAVVEVIEIAFSVIVLIFFLSTAWREYWIEVGRQKLFKLRDEVFDLAADGQLSFDGKAYGPVRELFNSAIRYTHTSNLHSFVAAAFMPIRTDTSRPRRRLLPDVLATIEDSRVRSEIESKLEEAVLVQFGVAFVRSPVGLLLLLVVGPILYVRGLFTGRHR